MIQENIKDKEEKIAFDRAFDLATGRWNANMRYMDSLRYANELEEMIEFSEQRILSIFLIHIFLLENLTNLVLVELLKLQKYKDLLNETDCKKIDNSKQTFGDTIGYLKKIFTNHDFVSENTFFELLIEDLGTSNKKRIKFVHKYFNSHQNDFATIQELQNAICDIKSNSIRMINIFPIGPESTLAHCIL